MCECKVLVGFCFYDVMLSRRQTLIKSSRAISRVNSFKTTSVSGTIMWHHCPDFRDTDGPWSVGGFNELTRLISQEDFIKIKLLFFLIWRQTIKQKIVSRLKNCFFGSFLFLPFLACYFHSFYPVKCILLGIIYIFPFVFLRVNCGKHIAALIRLTVALSQIMSHVRWPFDTTQLLSSRESQDVN
jgi:hypothetical protein